MSFESADAILIMSVMQAGYGSFLGGIVLKGEKRESLEGDRFFPNSSLHANEMNWNYSERGDFYE